MSPREFIGISHISREGCVGAIGIGGLQARESLIECGSLAGNDCH